MLGLQAKWNIPTDTGSPAFLRDRHCRQGASAVTAVICFLLLLLRFSFWLHCGAYGISTPHPGINPGLQQWDRRVLTSGPPGNSPLLLYCGGLHLGRRVVDRWLSLSNLIFTCLPWLQRWEHRRLSFQTSLKQSSGDNWGSYEAPAQTQGDV